MSEPTRTTRCGATFELANGEHVSPCHLPDGHDGRHEGYCLGSRAVWESDEKHTGEEQERWKHDVAHNGGAA